MSMIHDFERLLDKKLNSILYNEVFTSVQAAKFLQVSIKTLYRLKDNEGLPVHYAGRNLRFLKSELLRWLSNQKRNESK